ncbi:MAG: CoA-binding protein [Thermaerobacter sp.]|nr:CoA-binding protein [Thermaerobacter sp.]
MQATDSEDDRIAEILRQTRTVAVVGLSPKPDRDSYRVAAYLQTQGYRIVPVHPQAQQILGETVYRRLQDIPCPVDVVDVFRRAEDTPAVAEAAISIGARTLWLQLGISNVTAAALAEAAGLAVVMNRCMKQEHERWQRQKEMEQPHG